MFSGLDGLRMTERKTKAMPAEYHFLKRLNEPPDSCRSVITTIPAKTSLNKDEKMAKHYATYSN